MSKILKQEIIFKNRPFRILWKGTSHLITSIQEAWVYRGRWWKEEPERVFYLVELADGTLCEIYRELPNNQWFLYRLYD
ncbi:MAG: DUF6504 family protein [Limnochordia bacterium]|jgi:hypothetical protein